MDYGYKFENLINKHLGRPDYVTYAIYWNDKNERVALLFTCCLKLYDHNSSGEIGEKLEWFMEELFKESEDKKVSIECLNFLSIFND
jgi:hypothetical protein